MSDYDIADDPYYDDCEKAMDDCHMFEDGGVWFCGAAGSEWCSFKCPFSDSIGEKVPSTDSEASDE